MVYTSMQTGSIALGIAAGNGHTETVQRLLKEPININHQNKVSVSIACAFSRHNNTLYSLVRLHSMLPPSVVM